MSNVKILVVDDEDSIRRFLRVTLNSQAYTVLEAASGKDALSRTVEDKPDILILDLGLPDIDGVDTVEMQMMITRRKAGIFPHEDVEIERFTVTKFKED